ncbi:unnamed protein product [Rhizophagus irregularis]|nr:unnamed protein product [Rhizophagus irregularis]
MKCYRCEKRSTYSEVYKKTHYGGMQEYDKWVTNPINPSLHRQYAHEWLQCNSKSSRDTHFKEHGVRYSKMDNQIHFINQNKLSMEQLQIAQKRMDYIELPSDIGRILPKIAIGNEDNNDRKILGHFVRACNLLVARFITEDDLNIHLALHIPDCCCDYGSIYSFWLFPYERLNGYIDYHLSYKWSSGLLKESLSLIMPKKAVGSLAFTAEKDELQHFLSMIHNTSTFSKIYGTEKLPGQMLNPSCFKVIIPLVLRRFLCEWYSILYEKEQNEILGFMDLVIDQHVRLQIGAEIFGSIILGHQEKNVTILAKWKASNDDSVDIYSEDVQYYFEHTLRLPERPRKHLLAYVKWYKSAPSSDIRFRAPNGSGRVR